MTLSSYDQTVAVKLADILVEYDSGSGVAVDEAIRILHLRGERAEKQSRKNDPLLRSNGMYLRAQKNNTIPSILMQKARARAWQIVRRRQAAYQAANK